MRLISVILSISVLVAALTGACASSTPGSQLAPVPSSLPGDRESHFPNCHWIPVAPDWNEPCSPQTRGAKVEVTSRADMRPASAQKEIATCECD